MGATRKPRTEQLRVLFVCTANIARSPYAERRAIHLLAGTHRLGTVFASAGIPGVPGRPMDPEMAEQLSARGGDQSAHVSRSLTAEIIAQSDLVVTFEFAQRMRILDAWPDAAARVLGLHQVVDAIGRVPSGLSGQELVQAASRASAPDSMTWDVRDPHRRGRAAARRCADEIDDALAVIVPVVAG